MVGVPRSNRGWVISADWVDFVFCIFILFYSTSFVCLSTYLVRDLISVGWNCGSNWNEFERRRREVGSHSGRSNFFPVLN
jgi:hypothetical protein